MSLILLPASSLESENPPPAAGTERQYRRRHPRLPVEFTAVLIPCGTPGDCRIAAVSTLTSLYGATFVLQHKADLDFFSVGGEVLIETALNSLRGQINDCWRDKKTGNSHLSVKLLDGKNWTE